MFPDPSLKNAFVLFSKPLDNAIHFLVIPLAECVVVDMKSYCHLFDFDDLVATYRGCMG